MKKLRVGLAPWLKENAIGLALVALTITINYETLYETLEPATAWMYDAFGILVLIVGSVLSLAAVVSLGWLASRAIDRGFTLVVNRSIGGHMAILDSRIAALERNTNGGEGRLVAVEKRLGISDEGMLNLSDNLPPESIRAEIQRFEREQGFRDLWPSVRRYLRSTRDGYVIIEHSEREGQLRSGGVSHCASRLEAESRLKPGSMLIHVIESDWVSKATHMVTLDIGGVGDSRSDPHRERHPTFMSVDHSAGGSYRFRMELQEIGKDESTARVFDWWLDRLQNAATEATRNGERPVVIVQDNCVDDNLFHQTQYLGQLCVEEGTSGPRRKNGTLFEFNLDNVKLTATWRAV